MLGVGGKLMQWVDEWVMVGVRCDGERRECVI